MRMWNKKNEEHTLPHSFSTVGNQVMGQDRAEGKFFKPYEILMFDFERTL